MYTMTPHPHCSIAKRGIAITLSIVLTLQPVCAYANPQGGVLSSGQASISQSGNTLDVTQTSNKAVINWTGFDIAPGETTQFFQPSSGSIALNRVNRNSASQINGNLLANGDIIIINQNGVMFGAGSKVDVNGLVATTANISDSAFMNNTSGLFTFDQPGNPNASIINNGTITAAQAGLVGLVAPNVINNGTITANLGKVQLASGDTFTVDMYGDNLMSVAVSNAVTSQLVANNGLIEADGGKVALTAAAGQNIVNSLITVPGEILTPAVAEANGEIYIYAAGSNPVANNVAANKGQAQGNSMVLVSGTLDASGTGAGQTGGNITVTGDHVGILSGANINASGDAGGGVVQIGGDFHGQGTTPTAEATVVQSGTTINASADTTGNGGNVTVWADDYTNFAGDIEAKGGSQSGNGGYVETSGHVLDFAGTGSAAAPNGIAGTWLLDPNNVTIDANATSNPSPFTATWTSTGTSDLLYSDIQSFLNAGTNVTINASGSITVSNSIAKTAGADATLDLEAGTDIVVNSTDTISSTTGKLNLIFDADTAAGGGAISIAANITTNGGNITLGGQGSPAMLAAVGDATYANGIYINGATLNAGAGSITMNGKGYGGTAGSYYGVYVAGATVEVGGTGNISITGTGGGNSSDATGSDDGVVINSGGMVESTNATGNATLGTITIQGTGGDTGGSGTTNYGVYVGGSGSKVTSVDGNVSITGTGSNSSGEYNYATVVANAANVTGTGNAGVSINGTAYATGSGGTVGNDFGVDIQDASTVVSTNNGNLSITGIGGAASNGSTSYANNGVQLTGGSNYAVKVTGTGNLTIQGTGGTGTGTSNIGVDIANAATVYATSGTTTVTGIDGSNGGSNSGIYTDNTSTNTIGKSGTTTGNITLITNDWTINKLSVNTTGALLVDIYNSSGSIDVGSDTNNTLQVSSAILTDLHLATSSSNTFGDTTNNSAMDINYTTTLTKPAYFLSNGSTATAVAGTLTSNVASGSNPAVTIENVGGGITMSGNKTITESSSGAIDIIADGTFTTSGNNTIGGGSASGNVLLEANTLTLSSTHATNTIETTGGITIEPYTSGNTVGVGSGSGNLSITGTDLGYFNLSSASSLTIGSTSTGAMDINYSTSIPTPTTFTTNGANITLDSSMTTSGKALTFNDPVIVNGNYTLTTANGNVTFASTVDDTSGDSGDYSLTVANSSGNVTFGGAVGGTTALSTLSVTGSGTATLDGNVTTTSTQSYSAPVVLGGNDTLTTTNSNVTFSSTVNGAEALTVAAGSGNVTYTGVVGGTTALTSLNDSGSSGTSILYGNVTTTGNQTYAGNVTIEGNDVLTTTNSAVDFASTVNDSASNTHSLTVSAGSGLITFGSTVGATNKLASLAATSTTDIDINGNVTTGGTQAYTGPVLIGANDTLTTTNSAVDFTSTLDDSSSNTHALTVSAGSGLVTFGGVVGGNAKLASLAATSSTDIDVNGNVTTGGTQTYTAPVLIGANDTLTTTNSAVDFTSTVDDSSSNTHGLTISAGSGLVTFGGAVGGNAKLASLAATSTTDIDVNGNVTTGGTQTYTGPVLIGANDTLTTTNSAVDFTSTVDDSSSNTHALTVSAGSGLITFGSAVGGNAKLASLATTSTTDIDVNGNVTTGGTQTYTGPVVLGASDTLTTTNSNVQFTSTVDGTSSGSQSLTVSDGTATTTFGGVIGGNEPLNNLTLTDDAVSFGGNIKGTGTLTLQPSTNTVAMNINDGTSSGLYINGTEQGYIQSDWAALVFGDTSMTTGGLTVGASSWASPTTFETSGTGTITVSGTQTGTGSATLTFNGPTTLNYAGTDATTANQAITFDSAVTVGAGVTINAGSGTTTFASTVNGANALTVTDSSGAVVFDAAVGGSTALSSLTTTGTTTLDGNVTTTGAQTYNNAVTLGGNDVLTTTNSNVTFGGTVNGGHTLAVAAGTGTVTYTGAVGGSTALTSVNDSSATGTTVLDVSVTTTGTQNYAGAVTLGGSDTLTTTNSYVTLGGAVNGTSSGAQSLTVSDGTATTTFSSTIGATTPLNNLTLTDDAVSFGGNIYGTGTFTLQPSTNTLAMHVNDGTSSGLYINSTEQGYIQSDWATLAFGDSSMTTGASSVGASTWASPTTFTTSGTGTITVTGTQTGSGSATLTFTGPTTLGFAGTDATTANQNITFNSAVTLAANSTINSGTATTGFGSTITGSTYNLTLTGDHLTFGGNVSGSGTLTIQPSSIGQAVNLNNGTSGLYLSTAEINDIQSGWASVVIGSASDTATLTAGAATWASPLTLLNGSGDIALTGAQTMGSNTFYANTASGNLTLASGAGVTSSAAGNAIVVATGNDFVNNSGSTTPFTVTGGGRFIGYSNESSNDTNSVTNAPQDIIGYTYNTLAPGAIVPATYNGTQNTWVYDVSSGTVTLTMANQTVTYGTAPNLSAILGTTYSFSCSTGCSSSVITGGGGTQPTLALSGGTGMSTSGNYNVGSWTIGGSNAVASNGYTVDYVTGTLTVNQKNLTVTGLTGTVSKTYNANTNATLASSNYTLSGVVAGVDNGGGTSDVVSVSNTSGSYDTKNVGTGKTVTVNGLAITGADAGDYNLVTNSISGAVGTIIAEALTVTAATNTKTYDSTTTATALPTITGGALQGSDTADFSEAYANANAGTNKTLTPSASVSDGNGGNNYSYTFVNNTTGIINQATLTITAATNTKTYDSTTSAAATPTVSGLQGSDSVTGLAETYANANAGTGKTLGVSAYTVNDGNSGNNYTVNLVGNNTGVINQATLTITAATNTKTYDGTTTAAAAPTVSGLQGSDSVTGLAEAYANRNAGNGKALDVTAYTVNDGNSGNNYTVSTVNNNTGVINQEALTVTAATNTKTYNASTNAVATPTITGGSLGAGDTANFSEVYANANAGTNKTLTPSGSVSDGNSGNNYTYTFVTNGTGVINPKALTVTANNQTITAGDADPAMTYRYTGLASGDNSAYFTGALSRTAGENVGTYSILQNTLAATGNYTIGTYNPGIFTINAANSVRIVQIPNTVLIGAVLTWSQSFSPNGFTNGYSSGFTNGYSSDDAILCHIGGIGTNSSEAPCGLKGADGTPVDGSDANHSASLSSSNSRPESL